MKFTCKTSNLKEAIMKVERVVAKKTTLPILENILIGAEKGRLLIAATNLEMAVKINIGAKIDNEGVITVPVKILSGFLSAIKDETISGELSEDNFFKFFSENHKLKIKGIEAKDFPIIPEAQSVEFFKIKNKDLIRAISGILVSVAHNDSRQELNGVMMKFEEDKIIFASTDSFRLTEIIVPLVKESISDEFKVFAEKNNSVIVPVPVFLEMQKITDEEEISFTLDQGQLFVSTNTVKIVSRLLTGTYPEYAQIVPQNFEISIKIEKEKFLDALKIAAFVSVKDKNEIKITPSEDRKNLVIVAQSGEIGDNVSTVPAQIEGEGVFEIFFNCRYVLDGLQSAIFSGEEVEIKLNKEKTPAMFKKANFNAEKDLVAFYVVMPIIKN